MKNKLIFRVATENDANELLEIYSPYVENTAITFEYIIPSLEDFKNRIKNTLKKYPYIIALIDEKIVGYAYASPFKNRSAYDWAVETSIYIDKKFHGQGIGKKLLLKLEEILKKQNILNVNACIAFTENEDEFLTNASAEFHKKMNYNLVGTFHKCGYKFNRWYDMIWMEKMIGEHLENQNPIIPFSPKML